MPNSKPSRNAKYLSNAQLSQASSPKNRPLQSTKTQLFEMCSAAMSSSEAASADIERKAFGEVRIVPTPDRLRHRRSGGEVGVK
jgi:hypothetical protein